MSEFRHALPLEIHSAVDSHGTVKSRHSDVIADGRSKKRRREDDDDGRKKEGGSAYGKLLHKRSFIIKVYHTAARSFVRLLKANPPLAMSNFSLR